MDYSALVIVMPVYIVLFGSKIIDPHAIQAPNAKAVKEKLIKRGIYLNTCCSSIGTTFTVIDVKKNIRSSKNKKHYYIHQNPTQNWYLLPLPSSKLTNYHDLNDG